MQGNWRRMKQEGLYVSEFSLRLLEMIAKANSLSKSGAANHVIAQHYAANQDTIDRLCKKADAIEEQVVKEGLPPRNFR